MEIGGEGTARLWSVEDGKTLGQEMYYGNQVQTMAFSPDGRKIFTTTTRWLHVMKIEDDSQSVQISPIFNCLLAGSSIVSGDNKFHFLDPSGNQIQIVVRPTGDAVKVVRLRLDSAEVTPIQGDPNELLEQWQRRLGLKINDTGEIVPILKFFLAA